MKKEKVVCPECGTEFPIGAKEFTAVANISGKRAKVKAPKTAQERIEALRTAGVDVSNLFAMLGPNGGDYVVSNQGGRLEILKDNDPLFESIAKQGTVKNRRLFRRWVMAQMFRLMSHIPHGQVEPENVTEMIHRFGYEYQWKMLMNELHAQMKMEGKDVANFTDRNRWFNRNVVVAMANDYLEQLEKRVNALPERKCKGIPYKRISGRDIFVSDLQSKLFVPLRTEVLRISYAKNAAQLYSAAQKFNALRVKMTHDTPQCKEWVDAYKGSGAFFTMQNLIRFHNCEVIDDADMRLDKYQSLAFITAKAEMYKNGDGWRMLGVLKKLLADNDIDIPQKMREWRK